METIRSLGYKLISHLIIVLRFIIVHMISEMLVFEQNVSFVIIIFKKIIYFQVIKAQNLQIFTLIDLMIFCINDKNNSLKAKSKRILFYFAILLLEKKSII
jgi:hypothetical protein